MEKKTILAFVLSLAVLIVWSVVFAPQPAQKTDSPAKEGTAPSPSAPGVSPQPSAPSVQKMEKPAESPALKAEEKEVTVETPLYSAVFSSTGASIKRFKLKKYRLTAEADAPLVELVHGQAPLIAVQFDPGAKKDAGPVVYHVEEKSLTLEPGSSPKELTFRATTPEGLLLQQTYRMDPEQYAIEHGFTISNPLEKPAEGVLKAQISNLPPKESTSYYSFIGSSLLLNNKYEETASTDLKTEKSLSGLIAWISYQEDYFMTAFVPEAEAQAAFLARTLPSGVLEQTWSLALQPIPQGNQFTTRSTMYMGPRDLDILKVIGRKLDLAIDFGWTDIIAKPLLFLLRFFYQYAGNYGIAIILLTILIKILFWPLTHKSYKSMKEMQKIQPLMAKIREKYKDNKEMMNKEMMSLYKTYKVNPMGGCLPMVIQIPVFFALFRILGNSIELRHAHFLWWINDLSAPDRLFHLPFTIPLMTPPSGIPVLTLLMGASMFIQQKMTPTPGDPTQAKIMLLMPVIFTFMFINFPSGLVLYWLVNNVLSIGQQYRILKRAA
jgi:YidC/Oxa1 family membrane protein insertase